MSSSPFPHLKPYLDQVRFKVQQASQARRDPTGKMLDHFTRKLGQLLRPSLVLAASELSGKKPTESALALGALVELVHAASLLHDDVIDKAETRRGQVALHQIYGARQAVLSGDLLLSHGLQLISTHATSEILDTLAAITRDLAKGQLLELEAENRALSDVEEYLEIIHRKTATFFGYSARLGALCAGLDAPEVQALETYGSSVGMAYQILDDLLDVAGEEETLGKPVGADLMNGRPTLPLLRQLAREEETGPLHRVYQKLAPLPSPEELRLWLETSGAFEEVVEDARGYCRLAEHALETVQHRPNLGPLNQLIRYLFTRLEDLTGPSNRTGTRSEASGAF